MTRWSAKKGENYWVWSCCLNRAVLSTEENCDMDNVYYEAGNYFRTKEECEYKGPRMQAIAEEEWLEPRWKPVCDEKYYYIDSGIEIGVESYDPVYRCDVKKSKIGNCFKTKEEAEEAREILLHALDEFWRSKGVRGRD